MTADAGAPHVVALVPAWRAAGFIEPVLEALAAQRHPNLEILVSDDASPDDTAAICERIQQRDPRFRLIRQPRNLGWVGNVNALLAEARGDYLVFAFHDDVLEPDYVERCVAALEASPACILAFSDIALVQAGGGREFKSYAVLDGVTSRVRRARAIASQRGSWYIPNRGVFRARAAAEIGGLRRHAAGEFSADWPWLLHMSLLGGFLRIPEPLVTKIYQPESLSRGWDFTLDSWRAATRSASEHLARARLPWRERAAIEFELVAFLARHQRRAWRKRLGGWLRRAGLRDPAPQEGAGTGRFGA